MQVEMIDTTKVKSSEVSVEIKFKQGKFFATAVYKPGGIDVKASSDVSPELARTAVLQALKAKIEQSNKIASYQVDLDASHDAAVKAVFG